MSALRSILAGGWRQPEVLLYLMAGVAEFVAVYPAAWRDVRYAYCPPQLPRWSFTQRTASWTG